MRPNCARRSSPDRRSSCASFQAELEEAAFFQTRGGFERVVTGVRAMQERYSEHNLKDAEAVQQVLASAQERLRQFDMRRQNAQRERLEQLAEAFADARQPGLRKIVADYMARFLPATGAEAPGDRSDGPSPGGSSPGGGDGSGRE